MYLNLCENAFGSRALALFLETLALHFRSLNVVRAAYPRDLEVNADPEDAVEDPTIRTLRGKLNFLRNLERAIRPRNRHLSISFT
jgi:hypothetical protein